MKTPEQTAVEWIIEYCDRENWSIPNNIIEKAKEMEKYQTIKFAVDYLIKDDAVMEYMRDDINTSVTEYYNK